MTFVGASAASDASPVAYRSQLNALCRVNTPEFVKLESEIGTASKTGDSARVFRDLGFAVALTLRQDAAIEDAPVPREIRESIAPALRLLRRSDSYLRAATAKALNNDVTGLLQEIRKAGALDKPINKALDASGLQDCGSNQA